MGALDGETDQRQASIERTPYFQSIFHVLRIYGHAEDGTGKSNLVVRPQLNRCTRTFFFPFWSRSHKRRRVDLQVGGPLSYPRADLIRRVFAAPHPWQL